jgi:hypothetical protein
MALKDDCSIIGKNLPSLIYHHDATHYITIGYYTAKGASYVPIDWEAVENYQSMAARRQRGMAHHPQKRAALPPVRDECRGQHNGDRAMGEQPLEGPLFYVTPEGRDR